MLNKGYDHTRLKCFQKLFLVVILLIMSVPFVLNQWSKVKLFELSLASTAYIRIASTHG